MTCGLNLMDEFTAQDTVRIL